MCHVNSFQPSLAGADLNFIPLVSLSMDKAAFELVLSFDLWQNRLGLGAGGEHDLIERQRTVLALQLYPPIPLFLISRDRFDGDIEDDVIVQVEVVCVLAIVVGPLTLRYVYRRF